MKNILVYGLLLLSLLFWSCSFSYSLLVCWLQLQKEEWKVKAFTPCDLMSLSLGSLKIGTEDIRVRPREWQSGRVWKRLSFTWKRLTFTFPFVHHQSLNRSRLMVDDSMMDSMSSTINRVNEKSRTEESPSHLHLLSHSPMNHHSIHSWWFIGCGL